MGYLIKISFDKVKTKELSGVKPLFEGENKQRFIKASSNNTYVIMPPLFDHLEYDFNILSVVQNKARFTLIEQLDGNKAKKVIDECRYGSDEYNEILRKIRF